MSNVAKKRTLIITLVILAVPLAAWAYVTLGGDDIGRYATALEEDFRDYVRNLF